MKKLLTLTLVIVVASTILFSTLQTAEAAKKECVWDADYGPSISEVLNRVACGGGLIKTWQNTDGFGTEESLINIVGNVISIVLGFVGVLFIGLMLYAGFLWMTARGNAEQVESSQNYIRNAIIGIIIVFAVFTLSRFIINAIEYSIKL